MCIGRPRTLPGLGRIVSVNLAAPEPDPAKSVGLTGINKRPVDHPVWVRAHGVTIALAAQRSLPERNLRVVRAYLTEPELLPELIEIEGLPDALRETSSERLHRRR